MKSRCRRYSPFVCVYVGKGGEGVTNDWYIIHRKDDILDKVFVVFIPFTHVYHRFCTK